MRLKTVFGVKDATRLEVADGYYVAVKIDKEYLVEKVMASVDRVVFSWADKRKIEVTQSTD